MRKVFLRSVVFTLFFSLSGLSVTPKTASDLKPRKSSPSDDPGAPNKGDGPTRSSDITPRSHGPDSGPTGPGSSFGSPRSGGGADSGQSPRPTVFPDLPTGGSQRTKAADTDTSFFGGLKALAGSDDIKVKIESLFRDLAVRLNLSEDGTQSLKEAFALLYKQEDIYKDGRAYAEDAKSFVEKFLSDTQIVDALKVQGFDSGQFAGDLILAFRNMPDKLMTEMKEISDLLKTDPALAASRIAARQIQVSTYSNAFKAALAAGKTLSYAEKAGDVALEALYVSKKLTPEEQQQLCACLTMPRCRTR